MTMGPAGNHRELIDEARRILCERIVDLVKNGNQHIRIRQFREPSQICFYTRSKNQWEKQDALIDRDDLLEILDEQLKDLCSRPHSAGCEIREHSKPVWHDTDLCFDAGALNEHASKLDSYLYGLLF